MFLPEQFADGTLAFYRGKNATSHKSYYKIKRGRTEKQNYNQILELNGKSQLPFLWWPYLPISPNAERSGFPGNL